MQQQKKTNRRNSKCDTICTMYSAWLVRWRFDKKRKVKKYLLPISVFIDNETQW